ncbi:MAG: hypothetical protein CMJ46_04125 [Planctomyces sp.]|nr:hypothetical protein [Planctomyces sp.]
MSDKSNFDSRERSETQSEKVSPKRYILSLISGTFFLVVVGSAVVAWRRNANFWATLQEQCVIAGLVLSLAIVGFYITYGHTRVRYWDDKIEEESDDSKKGM